MATESASFPTSSSATTSSNPAAAPDREAPLSTESIRHDNERASQWAAEAARSGAASADDLIGRIAQSAHRTIDQLAEGAAPRVNRLQESAAGAGESLQAAADRAREVTDEWTESLRCTVRESPLAALGVALAVGMLIARLAR
jgi:ElaB/YqjD/DUF883 family membrane-anchored ribosome-binding protein